MESISQKLTLHVYKHTSIKIPDVQSSFILTFTLLQNDFAGGTNDKGINLTILNAASDDVLKF